MELECGGLTAVAGAAAIRGRRFCLRVNIIWNGIPLGSVNNACLRAQCFQYRGTNGKYFYDNHDHLRLG